MMASRLSPASSQSSLTASNSSLYEPERRPPDPAPVVAPSSASTGSSNPASSPGDSSTTSTGETCASFTIKRKKRKNPLTRAASIADPSSSCLPFSPSSSSSSSTTATNPSSSSSAGQNASSDAGATAAPAAPTFDIDDLRIAFSLMDTNKDGRISMSELADSLTAFGFSYDFTINDVQHMIHSASQGKESMSETEFITWITNTTSMSNNNSLIHSIASSLKGKRSGTSSSSSGTHGGGPTVGSSCINSGRSSSLSSILSSSSPTSTTSSKHDPDNDPELERDLRAAFSVFDLDGNGLLSRSELRDAMRVLKEEDLTDEQLDRLMRNADRDGDGHIGFQDFFAFFASSAP